MESPGSLPLPMNTVVFGGTAINNTVCGGGIPQVNYVGTTACAGNQVLDFAGWNGAAAAPQACIIDWTPQWVNPHVPMITPCVAPPAQQHTHYHFTPAPLSDADVERIAKRVAELLRGEKP